MTFRVTRLTKEWAGLTASFQKLFATGKLDGDAFSVSLVAGSADNVYTKSSLAKGDWTVSACEAGGSAWSSVVKFTVL